MRRLKDSKGETITRKCDDDDGEEGREEKKLKLSKIRRERDDDPEDREYKLLGSFPVGLIITEEGFMSESER